MADALQTLLEMNSPNNMNKYSESYTPNVRRNSARVGGIRKFLGMGGGDDGSISQADYESALGDTLEDQRGQMQAEAEARSIPERVRGEYGLASDRIRGSAAIEAARASADRLGMQLQASAENQRLNREAVDARTAANRSATDARAAAGRDATSARAVTKQQMSGAEMRARALETGKAEPNYPPTNGIVDNLKSFFGLGQFDKTTAARNEAAQLRGGGAAAQPDNDIMDAAQDYAQEAATMNDAQLRALIASEQTDATPEAQDALFRAIRGL